MEAINLKLEGDQKEIVVREGQAAPVIMPSGFSITASPSSVIDFYTKRVETHPITPQNSHLAIDVNSSKCVLVVKDMITPEKITITGQLKEDKDYTDLGINENRLFNETEIEKVLRKKPHLFLSTDDYSSFMKQLRNFTADVRLTFSKGDDRKGAQSASLSTNIDTSGLEKTIQLKISPWVGEEKKVHNIEILVTQEGGAAMFYFECVELMLEKDRLRIEEFAKVADALKALPTLYI